MKKCVYTSIVGNYDSLCPLSRKEDGWDYICFTDQNFTSDFWTIKPLPEGLDDLSDAKKQRYVKLNAHKVLSEYDYSIYIDGNVDIVGNINELIFDAVISIGKHPGRNCIYEEAKVCKIIGKDTAERINKQINRYREEGFPKNYGLTQNCIILRHHNDSDCVNLMEMWWNEVKNGSHRDQLSLSYVVWKYNNLRIQVLNPNIFNSEYFFWKMNHIRQK